MKTSRKEKRQPGPTDLPTSLVVQVTVDDDNGSEPVYANYAEIVRSQHDLEIRFTRVPSKLSSDQLEIARAGEPVPVYPLCKVILPLAVAKGLSDAILLQLAATMEVPK